MAWYDFLLQVGRWNGSATEPVGDDKRLPTYDRRVQGGVEPWTETVTSVVAPKTLQVATPGNALRILWCYANVNPTGNVFPQIKFTLGSLELYRVRGAISHWEIFEGGADEDLVVSIDQSATVDVTVHYEEFTP